MRRRDLPSNRRLGAAVAAVLCLMLAADTWPGPDPASAQGGDEEYVDVAMALEFRNDNDPPQNYQVFGPDLTVVVMNHGTITAYDVEVVVDIVYPKNTIALALPRDVPIGRVATERPTPAGTDSHSDGAGYSLRWTIPVLPGLAYEIIKVDVITNDFDITQIPNVELFDEDQSPLDFYGAVTTSSFDLHQGNNTDRIWAGATNTTFGRHAQVEPDYSILSVSVDERHPSPGDLVSFTFVADAAKTVNINSQVAIGLTDGLAVDVDPDATPAREITTELTKANDFGETPAPVSYNDGVFTIGTRRHNESIGTLTATLPVRVAGDAVVNEECITVTITGNPPPGAGRYYDDPSDNMAELCLGDQPVEPLMNSQVAHFNLYSCVDNTNAPCGSADDVRVRAVMTDVPTDVPIDVFLEPGRVFIHVPDHANRKYDSSSYSVNAGTKVSWQVPVLWAEDSSTHTGWTNLSDGFTASGSNGGAPPGMVHIRLFEDPDPAYSLIYKLTPDTDPPWTGGDPVGFDPSDLAGLEPLDPFPIEFEKLGTYKLEYTVKFTRATRDGDENCDPDSSDVNQRFCAAETYIFHLGPIAELEVHDGGSSTHVAANRSALTIMAFNNGPDEPSGGARVTGLPTDAEVIHISQGRYDGASGVWNVSELRSRDYYRSAGQPEPILVLGASAGDTADVRIASVKNYEVCIGPKSDPGNLAHTTKAACEAVTDASWNSVPVYDYWPGNNTATITAQPGSTSALRTSQATAGIGLSWPPRPGAAAYGVEVSEDGGATWSPLALRVRGTSYTHTGIPVGATRHYRVHAIDGAGRRGLPFTTASAVAGRGAREASPPGAPEQMTLTASPSSRTEILLSWVKPADYGSSITGYTLQVADGRNGPWANVSPQPGVSAVGYDYGGLEPNTRKYFRIRATNEFGGGLWSEVAEARTVAAGVPGAPRDAGAVPFGDNAASVFWQAPEDDGHAPVTQYEVQWSANGVSGWSRVGSTADTTLLHSGLVAGATYFYQVRARNSAGWGPWSQPPTSAVPLGVLPPDPPSPRAERNGSTAMDIYWDPPYDDGGGTITGYQLEWSATGVEGTFRSLASPSATARSHTHTGLTPGADYHYRIRARNSVGWGEWSQTVRESTESASVPAAPTLTAQANGATEISLSWNKPNSGGAPITHYELEVLDPLRGWGWLTGGRVSRDTVHHIDRGLAPGTERQYRVRAVNDNGPGQWSPVRTVRTDAGGPDAPSILAAVAGGEHQIVLSWEPPANDNGSPVTGYRIERSRHEDGPWERLSNNHRISPYTDTRNLYPGMTRYHRVAAINRNGTGAWSSPASGQTDDGDNPARAPDAPTALRFTNVGQDQVSLAWDRPASSGGAPIIRYEYQETLAEENFTTTGTTGTIRGLDDGLLFYSFRVRAVNAVGEGDWSEEIHATLWQERSEQVRVSTTNITVTEGGTATFTVSMNRAPPLPVGLGLYPRGSADALLDGVYEYLDKALVPSGWSHPDGQDWTNIAHNWSQGVPVSITIPDDDEDNPDRVLMIDISLRVLPPYHVGVYDYEWNAKWGIDPERSCPGDPDSTCPTAWDEAAWRDFTGPSVKITVRDND